MNNKSAGEYRIEEFPISRISTIDIGAVGLRKHHIKALIELDVTEARKLIRLKKKQSDKISFNSWLIKCISHILLVFFTLSNKGIIIFLQKLLTDF